MSNNHNIGEGPVNALQFKFLLEGKRVPAPEILLEHYAALEQVMETDH